MYNDFLSEARLSISDIYLDPNNPRFWSEKTARDTPDRRITDSGVQTRTRSDIEKHGIEELSDSILRNGFLPMDRVVVRPIADIAGKYVVVEGNRRIAALKSLRERIENEAIDEEHIDEAYLQRLLQDTAQIEVLIYSGDDRGDIAWLLQGIRHISGIREWSPAHHRCYAAPEFQTGAAGLTLASDQFSVSVLLFELLTQQLPYGGLGGKAGRPEFIARAADTLVPPSQISSSCKHLPRSLRDRLDALVLRGLALKPEERYPDHNSWLNQWEELKALFRITPELPPIENALTRVIGWFVN